MAAHDNLLRCTVQENSAAVDRTVETELKESRDAACEAVAQLQRTNGELSRSVKAEMEVSRKLCNLEVHLQNTRARNYEGASDSDARLAEE